jgi:hypothetical protein
LTLEGAIICEHLSLHLPYWGTTPHPVNDRKAKDKYQSSEDSAMGEFVTVDVLADTIAVLGALGFFFLGYQALQMLKK